MQLPQLILVPYPSLPCAESNLALLLAQQRQMEEVMEKLQRVNRSLGLMLVAVEGARSRLENSLQHLHAVLDPAGEPGMGAGGRMGAGGWQHRVLAPCPTGRSPSAISTCTLHGSYFVLLVMLLVPTPPRAILFLASSALSELLGIPAVSTLLALAVAGEDGCGGTWLGTHHPGGAVGVGWGCSALSHPLDSPQGSGWWRPPTAVLGEPGWCFPGKSPVTGSPPPRRGRRWLGGWAWHPWELLGPSLGTQPGYPILLPSGRGPQGGLLVPRRGQDTS